MTTDSCLIRELSSITGSFVVWSEMPRAVGKLKVLYCDKDIPYSIRVTRNTILLEKRISLEFSYLPDKFGSFDGGSNSREVDNWETKENTFGSSWKVWDGHGDFVGLLSFSPRMSCIANEWTGDERFNGGIPSAFDNAKQNCIMKFVSSDERWVSITLAVRLMALFSCTSYSCTLRSRQHDMENFNVFVITFIYISLLISYCPQRNIEIMWRKLNNQSSTVNQQPTSSLVRLISPLSGKNKRIDSEASWKPTSCYLSCTQISSPCSRRKLWRKLWALVN